MLNRSEIIGNLCKKPELKETKSGTAVSSFSVATNSKWKDKATGEMKEEVEFHNVVVWGKLAEVCCDFLRQGSKVYMAGALKTQSWEDKESGKNMYRTEIVVKEMEMLDGKPKDGAVAKPYHPANLEDEPKKAHNTTAEVKEADLPF